MAEIYKFYQTAKEEIQKNLNQKISVKDRERLKYLSDGGKRWRSTLCLLIYYACGGKKSGEKKALDLTLALELLHSASLVHGDIIDGDKKRRGLPSYYLAYGLPDAILTGHKAIVLGLKNLIGHDPQILNTCFQVWEMLLDGEFQEINHRDDLNKCLKAGRKLYLDVIENKTASMFAGAAKTGSQEAKAAPKVQKLCWEYGRNLGIAYQLADDFDDLNNGRTETIPLAWIINHLNNKLKKTVIFALKNQSVKKVFKKFNINSRDFFQPEIEKYKRKTAALAKSPLLSKSVYKNIMAEIPDLLIKE